MNILEWLRQRLSKIQLIRFGISFVLATMLWGWVTQLQDPLTNERFDSIPITVNGLPDSLAIVTTLPIAAATFSGPESRIDEIRAADISISIGMNDITEPGDYRVTLNVSEPNGVETRSVEPSEVQIQVEEVVNEVFTLEPTHSLAEDDPRQINSISPSVSQVTVSGPLSVVSRVEQVILPVAVALQTSNFEALYYPYAVDSAGQRINDVDILPEQVSTVVELQTRGKAVSVLPRTTGNPAEGYSVQQRSVVPETILVDGPADVLESLLFVDTLPVDISDATGPISQQVGLEDLPEGIAIVDPLNVTVEVRVAIEDTTNTAQTISALPVEIVDLDPAFTAFTDPVTVSITIDAPQSALQSLAASDIDIRVSADGLTPGTHQVQLDVSLPDGVTLVSSDVLTVELTISDPAASPSATPDP